MAGSLACRPEEEQSSVGRRIAAQPFVTFLSETGRERVVYAVLPGYLRGTERRIEEERERLAVRKKCHALAIPWQPYIPEGADGSRNGSFQAGDDTAAVLRVAFFLAGRNKTTLEIE